MSDAEREAVEAAQELTEHGHALIEKARRVVRARAAVDREVALTPGRTPRHDGPTASHEWEDAIRSLERVMRVHPEVSAPLPRHEGYLVRQALDTEEQRTKLKRLRRRTPEQQAELDRLNAGRPVPAPATFTQ